MLVKLRKRRTSSATRAATDMAATRRGCVHPILPTLLYPASCRYCGICGAGDTMCQPAIHSEVLHTPQNWSHSFHLV